MPMAMVSSTTTAPMRNRRRRKAPHRQANRQAKGSKWEACIDPFALGPEAPSPKADARALGTALELSRSPRMATILAESPIPGDVEEVLRAAASWETCTAAAVEFGVGADALQLAARLYLKQVLFHDNADCYRILGIRPEASRETARRHFSWLLRWLHPDRNSGWDSAYAERVVTAWREISKQRAAAAEVSVDTSSSSQRAAVSRPLRPAKRQKRNSRPRRRGVGWFLLVATGVGVAIATLIVR